jgi:hypothetical protein
MRAVGVSLFFATVLAACLMLLPVNRAMACSCASWSEKRAMAAADVVFEGVVVEVPAVIPLEGTVSSGDPVQYQFAVETVLKGGTLADRALVETARMSASCGAEFALGERWRVFASGSPDNLSSNLCAGNRLLDEHAQIRDEAANDPTSPPGATAMMMVAVGAVALMIVGLALGLVRSLATR